MTKEQTKMLPFISSRIVLLVPRNYIKKIGLTEKS